MNRWLRPAICADLVSDQFAFGPTGGFTCVTVIFMHHVIRLLEYNDYVRCLLIDFSETFDDVLLEKLSKLLLTANIF